jgi:hypothetical protein
MLTLTSNRPIEVRSILSILAKCGAAVICASVSSLPAAASPSAVEYVPQGTIIREGGRVCVERFEENGSLNIWPLRIAIGGEAMAQLVGGTAICFYVPPSKYSLVLDWIGDDGKRQIGASKDIVLVAGGIISFSICRTFVMDSLAWKSGWMLVAPHEVSEKCNAEPHN